MSAFLRIAQQFYDEIQDPAVRAEFDQLVAALQRDGQNIIPLGNGGLGIDLSAVLNGQLLIGAETPAPPHFALARLTAGLGISVGNAAGGITVTNTGALVAFKTLVVSGQSDVVADAAADTLTLIAGAGVTLTTSAAGDSVTFAVSGAVATEAFKTIAVSGQSDVVADSATDTLTLAAGSNITITTDAATDTVTIAASSGSGHLHGLMRMLGDGATTTFNLLDIAEYLEHCGVGGSFQDPTTYALSADRTQIVFDAAPALAAVIALEYVIASA